MNAECCQTHGPSTCLDAPLRMWVAVWMRRIFCRLLESTFPTTFEPSRGVSPSTLWTMTPAVLLDVGDRPALDGPVVGLLPSAPGIEGGLVEHDVAALEGLQDLGFELELLAVLVVEQPGSLGGLTCRTPGASARASGRRAWRPPAGRSPLGQPPSPLPRPAAPE